MVVWVSEMICVDVAVCDMGSEKSASIPGGKNRPMPDRGVRPGAK